MPSAFSSRRLALQRSALLLGAALCVGALAQAQTKEVVIGYQDMVVPWRFAQETKELEKRTGYKVTYRKLGSGAEDHLAFNAAGFDAMVARLEQQGVEYRKRLVDNGKLRQLFLVDPNGISIELNFRDGQDPNPAAR